MIRSPQRGIEPPPLLVSMIRSASEIFVRSPLAPRAAICNTPSESRTNAFRIYERFMADLNNQDSLRNLLVTLRQEHRDLDSAIAALAASAPADQLQIQRLKKKKLALRDRITTIDDQLTPDIIA